MTPGVQCSHTADLTGFRLKLANLHEAPAESHEGLKDESGTVLPSHSLLPACRIHPARHVPHQHYIPREVNIPPGTSVTAHQWSKQLVFPCSHCGNSWLARSELGKGKCRVRLLRGRGAFSSSIQNRHTHLYLQVV